MLLRQYLNLTFTLSYLSKQQHIFIYLTCQTLYPSTQSTDSQKFEVGSETKMAIIIKPTKDDDSTIMSIPG